MFYIFEIFYRFSYFFISFFTTFLIIFLNKYNSTFLLLYYNSIDFDDNIFLSYSIDKTFIFRSPLDLLDFDFKYAIIVSSVLIIPNIIWNLYYFFFNGYKNLKKIKLLLIEFTLFFYFFNHLFFKKVFAFIWNLLEYLITNDLNVYFLNIDYDLNLYNFISSITELYIVFNLIFIVIFLFGAFFNHMPIKLFIKRKRLLIKLFACFLLICMLIDLYLVFCYLIFSIFIFFLIFYFYKLFYAFKDVYLINFK